MADEVVTPVEEQSTAPVEQPVAVSTSPDEDVATWRKRLAGKDQALTVTKKELEAKGLELEELRKWKAQTELANMSELEKAHLRANQLEQELTATRETARRENIAQKHPLYAQFANDTDGLDTEARAEAFEKFIKSVANEKTTDAFVDVNAPLKSQSQAPHKRTAFDVFEELKKSGNPFKE